MYLCLVLFTECLVLRASGSGLGQFSLHTGDLIEGEGEGEGEGEAEGEGEGEGEGEREGEEKKE